MTRNLWVCTVALAMAAVLSLAGCDNPFAKKTAAAPANGPTANSVCPMTGMAIDPNNVPPDRVRIFKGQKVGFCSDGCPAAWDKLTDKERKAKLDKVLEPAKAVATVNAKCPISGKAVNTKYTRQFKGQTVGFCCPMCPPAWDKLSAAEKQTKLDKAMGM